MPLLHDILRAALLALGCAVLVVVLGILLQARRDEQHFVARIDYTLDNSNRLIRESAQTVANVRHASSAWEQASKDQAAATSRAMGQFNADLLSLNGLIIHTDASINGSIAPKLADSIDSLNDTVRSTNGVIKQLSPIEDSLSHAAANADRLSSDPSIPETLHHIDAAAASTALTASHVEGTASDVQTYVHKLLKPARSVWGVIKNALDLASKASVLPW